MPDRRHAHKVLDEEDEDFEDVHRGLFGKDAYITMAYGGRLAEEYSRNYALRRIVLQLDRVGRARKVDEQKIDSELVYVRSLNLCLSNDDHIVALARAGSIRLLCSHDQDLHADFTNKKLLDRPRGKVYQNSEHKHLLRICKK